MKIEVNEGETYTVPLQPNPEMDIVLRGGLLVMPASDAHQPRSVTIISGTMTRTGPPPTITFADVPMRQSGNESKQSNARTLLTKAGTGIV